MVCLWCGFWAEARLIGLGRPCRRRARGAGRDALLRIRRGLHPRRREFIFGGERLGHFLDEAVGVYDGGARKGAMRPAAGDGRRAAPGSEDGVSQLARRRVMSLPAGAPAVAGPPAAVKQDEAGKVDRARAAAEVRRRLKEEAELQADRIGSWAPEPGKSCLKGAGGFTGPSAGRRSISWGAPVVPVSVTAFKGSAELWWSGQELKEMRAQRRRCGSRDASREATATPGGDATSSALERARPDGFQRGGDVDDPLVGAAASSRRAALVDALLPMPVPEVRWRRVAPPPTQPVRRRTRAFVF